MAVLSLVRSKHTLTCASIGSNGENNPWLDPNPTVLSSNQGCLNLSTWQCRFPGICLARPLVWAPYQFPSDWEIGGTERLLHIMYLIKLSWVLCILQNYLACGISYITICICFVSLRTISACFVSRTSSHACFVNYLGVFYTILNYPNNFCPLQNYPSVFCIMQNYPSMCSICLLYMCCNMQNYSSMICILQNYMFCTVQNYHGMICILWNCPSMFRS